MAYFPPTGSVVAFQGTVPYSVIGNVFVNGSVAAVLTASTNQSVSGTVTVGSMLSMPAIISATNSTTTPITSTLSFTGTGEEWKDFGTITVNVFTDATSAVDGLSIQQSSDNVNWDIRDAYTIPSMASGAGKTFGVQPAARFGRIVYTQGAQNNGAFRLQTLYHPQYTKPSSQRPQDGYTNETDLEQVQGFNMVYNGTTWDRMRGTTAGALITGSVQQGTTPWNIAGSVAAFQAGTNITSVSGNVTVVSSLVGGIFPISGSVAATIVGTPNVNTAGSVVAFQGTNPWIETFSNSSILAVPVGSVITVLQNPSIAGSYAEDAPHTSSDKGIFTLNVRNDTLSSVTSNDGDYGALAVGPAGEGIVANAPLTKWVQGTTSVLNQFGTSMATIAAQGASIFTYITGVQVANMSGSSVLVTFSGATSSVIGYTIAPAGGGSNIILPNAWKTSANGAFTASVSGVSSVYISAEGFISKT